MSWNILVVLFLGFGWFSNAQVVEREGKKYVVKKDKSIDIDDLSKRARYWFTFENKTNKPNEKVEEEINKPLSNDEVLELCKTRNPLGIIEAVTGSKPAVSELKTIESLIDNFDVDTFWIPHTALIYWRSPCFFYVIW